MSRFLLPVSFAIAMSILAPSLLARNKLDIGDYYLSLAPDLYERIDSGPTLSPDARRRMIEAARKAAPNPESGMLLDARNGYLRVDGSDSGERHTLTMALFRQPDGSPLIAVAVDENFEQEQENGGGPATFILAFYRVSGEDWTDRTAEIARNWMVEDRWVELPRFGTTVKIHRRGKKGIVAAWKRKGDAFERE